MTTPHTEGRVTFREDGDACHWSMLTADGRWLLAILHNGEAPSERQVANFRRLAACWNACGGVPTEVLEAYPAPFTELRAQRDQAVAALHVARDFIHTDRTSLADASTAPDGSIDPDDAEAVADYDNALALIDAAIANATRPGSE